MDLSKLGLDSGDMSRRDFIYRLSLAGLSVTALGALAGCSTSKSGMQAASMNGSAAKKAAKGMILLKSPTSSLGCTEPTILADKLGYYAEEGIKVEFIKVVSLQEALLSNSVDFTAWGTPSFINAVAKGMPVKWVAGLHQGGHAIIARKDSDISKVEDLVGKKIALFKTGTAPADIGLKLTLQQHGIDYKKDVDLIPMDPASIAMSVRQGAVDAGACCPHSPQQAIVQGWGKAVLSDWEGTLFPGKGLECGGLILQGHFMDSQPEAAEKVKRAYLKALDFIANNKEEAAKMMAEDLAPGNAEFIKIMELMLEHTKYTPMTDMKTVNSFAKHMYEAGMIKKLPDMEKYIPAEYQA